MWKRSARRGRAAPAAPRSAAFGHDEEEDVEQDTSRKRVLSQRLRQLKSGEITDTAEPVLQNEDVDDEELATDPLQKLRENDRYKTYEKTYGREERGQARQRAEQLRQEQSRQIQDARDKTNEFLDPNEADETSREAVNDLRKYLPTTFGAQTATEESGDSHQQKIRKEPPSQAASALDEHNNAANHSDGLLPISDVCLLGSSHGAVVSCISLDAAGSRFVTSSLDHTLRLWDFGSMDSRFESFRSLEPLGPAFPIRRALFSQSGNKILVAGGDNSVKILDRDGEERYATPSGDRYLHDMSNTVGHAAAILSADWNPSNDCCFAASSEDSTIRLWDSSGSPKRHTKLYKLKNAGGQKKVATAIAFSRDGSRLAAGTNDGRLSLFEPCSYSQRPSEENRNAHSAGVDLTSICFSPDDTCLLTRSTDDAMRLWDTRRMDDPLVTWKDLENVHDQTECFFSPDGSLCGTGTSTRKNSPKPARLVLFSRSSLKEVGSHSAQSGRGSIVAIRWHKDTNQILYGCADGSVHVLYDGKISQKGILRSMQKKANRRDEGAVNVGPGKIYTPNALPMFRDEDTVDSRGTLIRQREEKPPEVRPRTSAGIVARPSGSTLATFIKQRTVKQTWLEEDPREALLKLEEKAKTNPMFTKGLQPTILADRTAQEEEEDAVEEQKRRRTRDLASKKPRVE